MLPWVCKSNLVNFNFLLTLWALTTALPVVAKNDLMPSYRLNSREKWRKLLILTLKVRTDTTLWSQSNGQGTKKSRKSESDFPLEPKCFIANKFQKFEFKNIFLTAHACRWQYVEECTPPPRRPPPTTKRATGHFQPINRCITSLLTLCH